MGANNCRLLTPTVLKETFSTIDTVLFDCDGVIWRGGAILPGAIELTETLMKNGKRLGYVTNNSTRTQEQMIATLKGRGFPVQDPELVVCTARSTALYISEHMPNASVYMAGNDGIAAELRRVGISVWATEPGESLKNLRADVNMDVDAIVCGYDLQFHYDRLSVTTHLLHRNKNALFIVTNTDPTFPGSGGLVWPGCGSLIAAIQTAGCRSPDVIIGKPHSLMFDQLAKKYDLDASRTLIIGDRCCTDIGFASAIKAPSIFVQTGTDSLEEAMSHTKPESPHPEYAPTVYISGVDELDKMIKSVINR